MLSGFIDVAAAIPASGGVNSVAVHKGLVFIKPADSPTGEPPLVVGKEVSGTTTIYRVLAQ